MPTASESPTTSTSESPASGGRRRRRAGRRAARAARSRRVADPRRHARHSASGVADDPVLGPWAQSKLLDDGRPARPSDGLSACRQAAADGRRIARVGGRLDLQRHGQPAAALHRLAQPRDLRARERQAHDLRLAPPAASPSTGRRLTETARLRLRGLSRSVSVPVTVDVQIVSQPTRSGSTRVREQAAGAQHAHAELRARAAAAASAASAAAGGRAAPSAAQARRGGAASANCWTRLLRVSVTVSVPWQSTRRRSG